MAQPASTLATLLDVTPATRVWVAGHAQAARRRVEQAVRANRRPPTGPIELAILTPMDAAEAVYFARKVMARLTAEGRLAVIREQSPAEGHASQPPGAASQAPGAASQPPGGASQAPGAADAPLVAMIESLGARLESRSEAESCSCLCFALCEID